VLRGELACKSKNIAYQGRAAIAPSSITGLEQKVFVGTQTMRRWKERNLDCFEDEASTKDRFDALLIRAT